MVFLHAFDVACLLVFVLKGILRLTTISKNTFSLFLSRLSVVMTTIAFKLSKVIISACCTEKKQSIRAMNLSNNLIICTCSRLS